MLSLKKYGYLFYLSVDEKKESTNDFDLLLTGFSVDLEYCGSGGIVKAGNSRPFFHLLSR